jgi:hypothetical protein
VGARHVADGEERTDIRERQREDGVLDLDERGEEAGIAKNGLGHVCL